VPVRTLPLGGPSGAAMDYKLYFFDRDDRIHRRVDLTCDSDNHAEAVVAEHVDGHAMELWQGSRFLAHYPATDTKT